jgi:hypothetical protein
LSIASTHACAPKAGWSGGCSDAAHNPATAATNPNQENVMKLRHCLLLASLLLLAPLGLAAASLDATAAAVPAKAGANLVGTWVIDVSFDPELEFPPFQAIQAFHAGGTMTETTDLLGALVEGPGAGAWRGSGTTYEATFQLFTFDADHAPAGIIEVRERIEMQGGRRFTGRAEAFIIPPGETEAIPLGGGPIVGNRVRVKSLAE